MAVEGIVEEIKAKAGKPGFKLTEPPKDEEFEKFERQEMVDRFKRKYNTQAQTGNGRVLQVEGNEYKLFAIAELFDYDSKVLEFLDSNADEVLNSTNAINLFMQIEQIKLLRMSIKRTEETNAALVKLTEVLNAFGRFDNKKEVAGSKQS